MAVNSNIHISRDRRILGQYSEEEVRQGVREGRFAPNDLAWRDGMETWRPLSEVLHLEVPPDLPPITASATVAPGDTLLGNTAEAMPSWERRNSIGLFKAIIQTVQQILSQPSKTFDQMPTSGGVKGPLLFQILLSWLASVAAVGYQAVAMMINPSNSLHQELQGVSLFGLSVGGAIAIFVFIPIAIVLGSFIGSAFLHLALMIVGGAKKPFEATMRVYCYAIGGTSVFHFIPICGGLLALFWSWVLIVIGLARVHKIDYARAIIAVVLIFVLICGFILTVGAIGGFLIKDIANLAK